MSIEPTSATGPVMRDNDNGSLLRAGSGTQGSGTGRKEGQFGSFWDKAVFGAQRLFGMERSPLDGMEDDNDGRDKDTTRDEPYAENRSDKAFGAPLGLAKAGLGGLLQTVRREGMGGVPAFGSTDRSFEPVARDASKDEAVFEERSTNSRRESDEAAAERGEVELDLDQREVPEEDEDDSDESERRSAKTADLTVRPLPLGPLALSKSAAGNLLVSDGQGVSGTPGHVGINSAKQFSNDLIMPSLPQTQTPETTGLQGPTTVVGDQGVLHADLGNRPTEPNALGKEISGMAKELQGAGATISAIAQSVNQKPSGELTAKPETVKAVSVKDPNGLAFDSEKAQQDLSKLMGKGRSLESANLAKMPEAISSLKANVADSTEVATSSLEAGKQDSLESKLIEQVPAKTVGAKPQLAQQRAAASQQSQVPSSGESSASEISASKKAETSSLHEAIREIRPAEARSFDARAQANRARPANPSMASGMAMQSNGVTAAKAGMDAQSQGNSSENSGKQNFDMSSVRESGPKATVTAPKGESAQGFQLNGSSGTSSSKAEFAAKAQPTSYASKSVEEVKEVYSALTKSVERLVNAKGETINIRINFDQGGSMALRVSMDGGKVNTTMQTDLPGLEGLIKSNWSELAADWNAKGVKLSSPQFTHGNGESSREETASNFEQRESQSQNSSSGDSRSRGGRGRESDSSASAARPSPSEVATHASESEAIGEQELKTYA